MDDKNRTASPDTSSTSNPDLDVLETRLTAMLENWKTDIPVIVARGPGFTLDALQSIIPAYLATSERLKTEGFQGLRFAEDKDAEESPEPGPAETQTETPELDSAATSYLERINVAFDTLSMAVPVSFEKNDPIILSEAFSDAAVTLTTIIDELMVMVGPDVLVLLAALLVGDCGNPDCPVHGRRYDA